LLFPLDCPAEVEIADVEIAGVEIAGESEQVDWLERETLWDELNAKGRIAGVKGV